MRLLLIFENTKGTESFAVDSFDIAKLERVKLRLSSWLDNLAASAARASVCKSFIISAHVLSGCEHEVPREGSG